MKVLTVEATKENLDKVIGFLDEQLEEMECPMKILMQMELAVEEIYINVASYAYGEGTGQVTLVMDVKQEPKRIEIEFQDQGAPYNPLEKQDPDIRLSAEEREIGGLGVYLAKKYMDEVAYAYEDGKNILCMRKILS